MYVDCGARAGTAPRWLSRVARRSLYVGFEPDEVECARLSARGRPGHTYIAAALDSTARTRTLHLTRSPACTSFLEPNAELVRQFGAIHDAFDVLDRRQVNTVALDDALRERHIDRVDVLELDTQGSELDILHGATAVLAQASAVQIEVEFAPMYHEQPLFADVDCFLRGRGYALYDLSRYALRHAAGTPQVPTRGRLLWGHALYLREIEGTDLARDAMIRLAVVSAALGYSDVACAVLARVEQAPDVGEDGAAAVCRALRALQTPDVPAWPLRLALALERRGFERPLRALARAGRILDEATDPARRAGLWRT